MIVWQEANFCPFQTKSAQKIKKKKTDKQANKHVYDSEFFLDLGQFLADASKNRKWKLNEAKQQQQQPQRQQRHKTHISKVDWTQVW